VVFRWVLSFKGLSLLLDALKPIGNYNDQEHFVFMCFV
jgi:hypothetical protein